MCQDFSFSDPWYDVCVCAWGIFLSPRDFCTYCDFYPSGRNYIHPLEEIKMNWSFLFFFNSILLGAGLAMDAFSVSMANGLNEPEMSRKRMFCIAGTFAAFQAFMPMTGWVCVHTIVEYFNAFETFIPWIALILLAYIGGSMLISGIRHKDESEVSTTRLTAWALFIQGIATSIDALSVGFTIAEYDWLMALVCSLIIAAVTLLICLSGLVIGKKFGTRLANRAEILGGVILIAIGVEIFASSWF